VRHAVFSLAVAVLVATTALPAEARVRTFYIAADEVVWNYVPSGKDVLANKPLPPLQKGQMGWSYHKAVYHDYTDATFTHVKRRMAADDYLGLIGPILHAEVGDTIVVVFKNNASFPLSIHPHGVFYGKSSEGAPYEDGVPAGDKLGNAVAPGHTFKYTWQVPERAGPGPSDPSSVMWMYHSHYDEVHDVNTGPLGAIVVTRRGMAKPDGTPRDVDREVFVTFSEQDEGSSRYYAVNLADPALNPHHVKAAGPFPAQYEYQLQNEMYNINGFSFGNMPMPTMRVGEHVRWYVMSTMSDFDFHTPHWHGNTLLANGMRTDVVQLFPMQMVIGDMVPDNAGVWLIHCHVNLHLEAGMEARYLVLK
jgi:FtsP/CotA-like multicopper oxidase with cupredoxin domain